MVKKEKQDKSKSKPFIWFLLAVVLPVVFAIILAVFIFSIAGFDVGGWAKEKATTIPVVSSIVKTEDEQVLEIKNEKLQKKLSDAKEENEQLAGTVDNLEEVIDQLETEQLKEEKKKENEKESETEADKKEDEKNALKQISGSFKDMDPEKAAKIVEQLDEETATAILEKMSNKVRGKVLEEMEPKKAADLTKQLVSD